MKINTCFKKGHPLNCRYGVVSIDRLSSCEVKRLDNTVNLDDPGDNAAEVSHVSLHPNKFGMAGPDRESRNPSGADRLLEQLF